MLSSKHHGVILGISMNSYKRIPGKVTLSSLSFPNSPLWTAGNHSKYYVNVN